MKPFWPKAVNVSQRKFSALLALGFTCMFAPTLEASSRRLKDVIDQKALSVKQWIEFAKVVERKGSDINHASLGRRNLKQAARQRSYQLEKLLASDAVKVAELINSFSDRQKSFESLSASTQKLLAKDHEVTSDKQPMTKRALSGASKETSQSPRSLSQKPSVKGLQKSDAVHTAQAIKVLVSDEGIRFKPNSVVAKKGERIKLVIEKAANLTQSVDMRLFVRDKTILSWNPDALQLISKKKGHTEVYLTVWNNMYVLPVQVGASKAPELDVPEELFSLVDVLDPQESGVARFNEKLLNQSFVKQDQSAEPEHSSDLAAQSVAPVKKSEFASQSEQVGYVNLDLRLVDDRSDVAKKLLYPVGGVKIRIVGTEFEGVSDARGRVAMTVPKNSRLIVLINDPMGRLRSGVKEIVTHKIDELVTVKLLRQLPFETYENVAGVVSMANTASFCATARNNYADPEALAGIEVGLDIAADGPYYFNRFGFLDPQRRSTSENGRFCFFNVSPGPIAVSFFRESQHLETNVIGMFSGRHLEDDFYLNEISTLHAHLGTTRTLYEVLSDSTLANQIDLVDMVDVIPLGYGESMSYLDEGLVGIIDGGYAHNERKLVLTQVAEFESVIYQLSASKDQRGNVTPLFPRGFVEDLALNAQLSYDPSLGVVLVDHARLIGEDRGQHRIRLLDQYNRDVGEGWYYGSEPVTKAAFFNLEPGTYAVIVETEDGYWLQASTVEVFHETTSYVRSGSRVVRAFAQAH